MTKPIPRSRLHITYRTKIDGTPKRAELPMRFLVLGDFTSHDQRGLNQREVHSIMPGMQLSSFMEELQLSARIDDPTLAQRVPAQFSGTITGKWKAQPAPADAEAGPQDKEEGVGTLKITGRGVVSGDIAQNGIGSFSGEVEISNVIEVPCVYSAATAEWSLSSDPEALYKEYTDGKLMLFGKVEPAADTELGKDGLAGNVEQRSGAGEYVPQVVKQFKLVAPEEGASSSTDDIDPDPTQILPETRVMADKVWVHLTIPLRHLNHFRPSYIAQMVPEIRRLVLMRSLALETRNYLANYPELRDLVKQKLDEDRKKADAGEPLAFQGLRTALKDNYPQLLISPPAPAAGDDTEETEDNEN